MLDFLGFLSKEEMIDIGNLKTDSDYGFENRLKIQKYVYLAMECYDLDLNYPYSVHLFGPYSRKLSKDYYDLNTNNVAIVTNLPAFKKDEFLLALKGKSSGWLEVAGMIIFETNRHKSMPELEYIYWVKPSYSPEFIDSVYVDMCNLNIV